MLCENCNNEHDGSYGSGRFCSCKCSRGFSTKAKRSEINEKVSKIAIDKLNKGERFGFCKINFELDRSFKTPRIVYHIPKICECCKKEFISNTKTKRFCSKTCSAKSNYGGVKGEKDLKFIYRQLCNFKFSLDKYPLEFNFDLIKQYGWYSAGNRGNNLNGVSRDHRISCYYGFTKRINPKIISHPANCELQSHIDNNKKNIINSISFEDLMKNIKCWNLKYNESFEVKPILTDGEIINMYRQGA